MKRAARSALPLAFPLFALVAAAGCPTSPPPGTGDAAPPADGGVVDVAKRRDVGATPPDMAPPDTRGPDGGAYDPSLAAVGTVIAGRFATALVCAQCHASHPSATALRDEKGRPVGAHDLWQATMKANSARDPLWRAVVGAEVVATPSARKAIEAKCMRCHAPMAHAEAAMNGEPPVAASLLKGSSDRAKLALDGVSCTGCHQITAAGLGTDKSYTGGFTINDRKEIYGPVRSPFGRPMINASGFFTPVYGAWTSRAALCGSCHTLMTKTLTPAGKPTGHTFVEQATYLEWRNSDFDDERTPKGSRAQPCQGCHMPSTSEDGKPIRTQIARRPRGGDFPGMMMPPRPLNRHLFVGGNTLIPAIIRDNAATLRPGGSRAAFDAVIARARAQLRNASARLALAAATRSGERLRIDVALTNLVGHKLPSGYPSRRMWLRVEVRDAAGKLVFRSGGFDARGRLVDAAGKVLASELPGGPVQPHRARVTASSEVQIYEAVMAGVDRKPTFTLLRAAAMFKDNRLLPSGWKATHPDAARTRPVGTAGDADFAAPGDRVRYEVAAPRAGGPYKVTVSLHYQTLGARFAAEIFRSTASEMRAFQAMFARADPRPVEMARVTRTVP